MFVCPQPSRKRDADSSEQAPRKQRHFVPTASYPCICPHAWLLSCSLNAFVRILRGENPIMSKVFLIGMSIIFISGLFNGSFAWPMKYALGWKWENLWLFFTFLALVVLPLALTITFVPHLRELYATAPLK